MLLRVWDKISSHPAEPHSTCGCCRFNLVGGSCTFGASCDECRNMNDKDWQSYANLNLKLWKKSLQHFKKKLPAILSQETRLERPLLTSLFKSLPPTITIYKSILIQGKVFT